MQQAGHQQKQCIGVHHDGLFETESSGVLRWALQGAAAGRLRKAVVAGSHRCGLTGVMSVRLASCYGSAQVHTGGVKHSVAARDWMASVLVCAQPGRLGVGDATGCGVQLLLQRSVAGD